MPRSCKGILCLETDWWGIDDPTTVEPILRLLNSVVYLEVPYIHRGIGTRVEFEHYIQKWTNKGLGRYPILYLGFHGDPGVLYVGDQRSRGRAVSLDDLAELLDGRCKGKIIHFGSCSTLDVHGRTLSAFRRRTGAVALFGYRASTDWVESAAFEILLLGELQNLSLTKRGMEALDKRMRKTAPGLYRRLGFRMVC